MKSSIAYRRNPIAGSTRTTITLKHSMKKSRKAGSVKKEIQEKAGRSDYAHGFTGSILLEHAPLNPDLPNMEDFRISLASGRDVLTRAFLMD